MGAFNLGSFGLANQEDENDFASALSPVQKQVFGMLMDNFARQADLQNRDPMTIADERLSGVSVGRQFLQAFFAHTANSLGAKKVQTIRERLVEREVLRNEMALNRLKSQEQQFRTALQFSGQISDDELARLKAQEEQKRFTAQDRRAEAQEVRAEAKEAREAKKFQQEQERLPFAQQKEEIELKTARARLEELNDPFSKVSGNTRAFIEAFREEMKRDPSRKEIESFLAKQKPVTQNQIQLLNQIPTNDPLSEAAQLGYRSALGQLGATEQKAFAASLSHMARLGAKREDFKQQMESITLATLPAGSSQAGGGQAGFKQRKENLAFLQILERDIDEFVRRGGNLGLLEGTEEKILERLGTLSKERPELASLAQRMGTFFIAFRKQHSGVAFRENESAQYQALVPRITANVFLNKSIINDLREAYLRNHRMELDSAIGSRARREFFGELNAKSFVILPDGRILIRVGTGDQGQQELVEF